MAGKDTVEPRRDSGFIDLTYRHEPGDLCPGCGQGVATAGFLAACQTWDRCNCGVTGKEHLRRVWWHRTCFVEAEMDRMRKLVGTKGEGSSS